MRSEPACRVCASLTAATDRVAQVTPRGDYEPDESSHLALYPVRYACIRSGLGGVLLESRWRRCIGPSVTEVWTPALRADVPRCVWDEGVVWRRV